MQKNEDSLYWKVDEGAGKLQAIIEACSLVNMQFQKEVERMEFQE